MNTLPVFTPASAGPADARAFLQTLRNAEKNALLPDFPVTEWVAHRTRQMDAILTSLYHEHFPDQAVTLFALGGYGRGELFPRSDIDLLILRTPEANPVLDGRIAAFVRDLWQLGPDIAQQVSDPATCLAQAKNDIDTLTSLLEARFIIGDAALADTIRVNEPPLIPRPDFIAAKLQEQHNRDSHQEQMGLLEPNIKIAPGGLRDIHMIVWVLAYCYGHTPQLAQEHGLTPAEQAELLENRDILWRIRYALHLSATPDHKDRLLFERQKSLASIFAWQDSATSSATEQFMRHYYRATRRIRRISRLIVKLVESQHLPPAAITPLDAHYCIRARRIDFIHPPSSSFFQENPEQLWQLFTHLQNHPELDGLHPLLARKLFEARDTLVTHNFRIDKSNRQGFMAVLGHPGNVYRQVRRMLRYGILYRYIPGFWHIVGRMQYDLFHQYTVDQHTLHLLAILDSFKQEAPAYPHASRIMRHLPDRAILYLAAIFHDIGKGYQGDHADIGAAMIESFALENDAISNSDCQRLVFLVKNHLLMSETAQKQDLSEPDVIAAFARTVGNRDNLDYLYLLTIADISATNANLWNSWRATLLSTLYQLTAAELETARPSLPGHIEQRKQQALHHLAGLPAPESLWQTLPDAFFLGESAESIAAKTRDLLSRGEPHRAIALPGNPPQLYLRSSHPPGIIFARATHFLERHNLDIVEARLYQNNDKTLTLQQYTLADSPIALDRLTGELSAYLASDQPPPPQRKRLQPSHLRHFPTATRIRTRQAGGRSLLEITCQDRHGLLSLISRILLAHGIDVDHAKITTLGEKAQDIFYLNGELTALQLEALRKALYHALNS